jgi:hypothetical protein
MTFGALLGGHVFEVDPSRLLPFLVATVLSGAGLMALEMSATCAWLFMGKGLAVLAKLLLLASVPLFWEQRVPLLLFVVVVASVGAHMPARLRHYSLLPQGAQGRAPAGGAGVSGRPPGPAPTLGRDRA